MCMLGTLWHRMGHLWVNRFRSWERERERVRAGGDIQTIRRSYLSSHVAGESLTYLQYIYIYILCSVGFTRHTLADVDTAREQRVLNKYTLPPRRPSPPLSFDINCISLHGFKIAQDKTQRRRTRNDETVQMLNNAGKG